ncbi:hypothetical protein Q6249_28005, partial [Klebsiella pneumoniae]|uniref:hypothetical protein n=1 Tax=Klebsiella pneumoniae TaxID=573 RepID=UPI00272FB6C4
SICNVPDSRSSEPTNTTPGGNAGDGALAALLKMEKVSAGYGERIILDSIKLNLVPGSRIGLSATAFGLGAGLFFLTYAVLEIPSNLIQLVMN